MHMKAPHTRVRRYSGEPTPSMLACTHTQEQAGPHICVFVQTLTCPHAASRDTRSEQRRTDTRERTQSRRDPQVQARTRPHTHTGHSAREAISCPLHPDDRLPLAPKEIPAVPPLRLRINTANPRAPQNSAILWWQQDHVAFFPLGTAFPRAASKVG